jgi:DNA-directed RNA polymerase alpha subunit
LKAELPAEGILKTREWGSSKMYKIICECGQSNHEHDIEIEADETGINVNVYTTVKTDYWSENIKSRYDIDSIWLQEFDWAWKSIVNSFVRKVKLTWELWTTGSVTAQTTIILSEQQALNYAETLKSAITDVKKFKKENHVNK